MRVLRGRAATIDEDRTVTGTMVADAAETGERVVRVWTPHRQVAFGRRDAGADGYERARAAAEARGYPPVERDVGGRAVAYTGSTVAFARAEPVADMRRGLQDRYSRMTTDLQVALSRVGVHARPGEPDGAFCPGTHSLQAQGKLVGIAQQVTEGAALVAGVVIARDHEAVVTVLDPVYEALGVPFDPGSVGSVERAGGDGRPSAVVSAVEGALVGDEDPRIEQVEA